MSQVGLKVAVITRTKDRIVLLKRAIESVLSQDYANWVHVIVNDGGDATAVERLISHYEKDYGGRIIVIHHSRSMGMESSSNEGIRRSDSDLVAIHDDDDSWAPSFLSRVVETFKEWNERLPSVQGVVTHCHRVLERVEGFTVITESVEEFNCWLEPGLISLDRMLYDNAFPPISFVFSRAAWGSLGGFRENLPVLGDWDFHVRFLLKYDIVVYPYSIAFYHHRPKTKGSLGNSVIDGVELHRLYRRFLLNEWLRADLSEGKVGMGLYANLRSHFEYLLSAHHGADTRSQQIGIPIFKPDDFYSFWNSLSWRITRPRNIRLRLKGLPPETKPEVTDEYTATKIVIDMLTSTSWDITGPLRVGRAAVKKILGV